MQIGVFLILNTDLGRGRRLRRPEKSQIRVTGCRGRQPLQSYGDFRVRQMTLSTWVKTPKGIKIGQKRGWKLQKVYLLFVGEKVLNLYFFTIG